MALFNFRRVGSAPAAAAGPSAQPESVETMRKRARHRLIGAVVLVLAGVIGFPLLFDTQPRPIEVDIPIHIPGKNSVKPLTLPEPAQVSAAPQNAVPPTAAASEKVATAASLAPEEEIISSRPAKTEPAKTEPAKTEKAELKSLPEVVRNDVKPLPKPKPDLKLEPKVEAKPAPKIDPVPAPPKPVVKAEAKPAAKVERPINGSADSVRAMALLNGQSAPLHIAPKAESTGRVVVQVGAFADAAKAQETRARLEGAGLKAFTQVVDVQDGKRTRVRVGPFGSRAEADQAAAKIRQLGLSAAILSH